MKNWSNSPFAGTLEDAVRATVWGTSKIGMEVRDREGRLYTLQPNRDTVGFAPRVGDTVECSGLGFGRAFEVVRVAEGDFIDHARRAMYVSIRDAQGETRMYLPFTRAEGERP